MLLTASHVIAFKTTIWVVFGNATISDAAIWIVFEKRRKAMWCRTGAVCPETKPVISYYLQRVFEQEGKEP